MRAVRFRCSSIGKLMTEPKTLKEGPLSVGAKTYIRSLAAQEIFSVEFEVSGKEMEKGIQVEPEAIGLLNRVRGLALTKNTERRQDDYITGECDLFDAAAVEGYDLKSSWSLATFPIATADCEDKLYEWQMRGYMRLWNAQRWHVAYAMVDTPAELIGRYEHLPMHIVGHIPEHMRLTVWTVERDMEAEARMVEKVKHARVYYDEVLRQFDRDHGAAAAVLEEAAATPTPAAPARGVLTPTF